MVSGDTYKKNSIFHLHHTAITMNSNQLTSWNEIPVEEKSKTQLVKKNIYNCPGHPSHHCVHNNLLADSILRYINFFNPLEHQFFNPSTRGI